MSFMHYHVTSKRLRKYSTHRDSFSVALLACALTARQSQSQNLSQGAQRYYSARCDAILLTLRWWQDLCVFGRPNFFPCFWPVSDDVTSLGDVGRNAACGQL